MKESRKSIAAEKNRCGTHNCTQAVVCTFADIIGMDEETLKQMGNGFGLGMGNMEGTCGALSGAALVLGLVTKDPKKSMKGMKHIMNKFQERNGATQCRLLKKDEKRPGGLRECVMCVSDATEFLEEELEEMQEAEDSKQ